jgi:hypothetical protein
MQPCSQEITNIPCKITSALDVKQKIPEIIISSPDDDDCTLLAGNKGQYVAQSQNEAVTSGQHVGQADVNKQHVHVRTNANC